MDVPVEGDEVARGDRAGRLPLCPYGAAGVSALYGPRDDALCGKWFVDKVIDDAMGDYDNLTPTDVPSRAVGLCTVLAA